MRIYMTHDFQENVFQPWFSKKSIWHIDSKEIYLTNTFQRDLFHQEFSEIYFTHIVQKDFCDP